MEMKKYILITLLVLLFNACSTVSEQNKEQKLPQIGPQLKLMGENEIELWLKGEWRFSQSIDTTSKTIYRYHENLGKQELAYDQNGAMIAYMSYEIKEDYFTNVIDGKTTITHLLVEYLIENKDGSIPAWNEYPIYREIEKINENEYVWYIRGYPKGTAESDFMKNPRVTGRATTSAGVTAINMKRM
ncbi:MAG: hypothetical protein ACRCV0_04135 [Brevinema sp.]